jgi:Flp pilus assembly protein TadD
MSLPRQRILAWGVPAGVVLAVVVAFSPILANGFVDWDDGTNFTDNRHFRGIGWTHLVWMATAFHLGVYQPLAWLAAALQFSLGGLHPSVYHAGSLAFHAGSAVLVYTLALLLFTPAAAGHAWRARMCAGAAALAFALHPLRVEAVAWASAQGYPLAAIFFLGSIVAYLHAHHWPDRRHASSLTTVRRGWLLVSMALGLCAFLSKPIAVTLPAVLLILDWYPLRRLSGPGPRRSVWMEKLGYAVPAAAIAAAAPLARAHAGLLAGDHYGLLMRLGQSSYGVVFYLWKTLLPTGLTFYYPLPLDASPWQARFVLSAVAVGGLAALAWRLRRRQPSVTAALLAYVALLSPVLGVIPQGGQLAADRYSYFAAIPLSLLMGLGLLAAFSKMDKGAWRIGLSSGALGVTLVAFGLLTFQQARVWRDSGTLWGHATTVAPDTYQSHNNLGLHYLGQGKYDSALHEFDETLRLNPSSAKGYFNRGLALAKAGRPDQAITSYRKGLALRPNDPTALAHLAELLANHGAFTEAEAHYRHALGLVPHPDLYNSLGIVLARQSRLADAVSAFREALALDPRHEDARANLDTALGLGEAPGTP